MDTIAELMTHVAGVHMDQTETGSLKGALTIRKLCTQNTPALKKITT